MRSLLVFATAAAVGSGAGHDDAPHMRHRLRGGSWASATAAGAGRLKVFFGYGWRFSLEDPAQSNGMCAFERNITGMCTATPRHSSRSQKPL